MNNKSISFDGLTKTNLRLYQKKACEMIDTSNTIIILPTGAGKTLIAACYSKKYINSNGSQKKVLFLVPTRLLVQQQAQSVRSETNLEVAEYMGSTQRPISFDVLVSTPSAFIFLQDNYESCKFNIFGVIIFDEVHHVVKRHPYKHVARRLSVLNGQSFSPKIIGNV